MQRFLVFLKPGSRSRSCDVELVRKTVISFMITVQPSDPFAYSEKRVTRTCFDSSFVLVPLAPYLDLQENAVAAKNPTKEVPPILLVLVVHAEIGYRCAKARHAVIGQGTKDLDANLSGTGYADWFAHDV